MRPLRYYINVTLDGCVDHSAGRPNEQTHRHAAQFIERADAGLYGRVTYQMMEAGWRGSDPDRPEWMEPFARTMNASKKYVVSSTLGDLNWNEELVRGDLGDAVRRLKEEPGEGLSTGGVTLPLALARLGLIDEYTFVVHPTIAGHGPWLFEGLSEAVMLSAIGSEELGDGIVATTYVPKR